MTGMASPNTEIALSAAADQLGVQLIGPVRYGWNRKSAGARAYRDRSEMWIRVQYAQVGRVNSRIWNGEIDAADIVGVKKPKIISYVDWRDHNFMWRATLMTLIAPNVCSASPEIRHPLELDQSWYMDLKASLIALEMVKTERVNTRQELISRRLSERFGKNIPSQVDGWVTCHGDLHWANLTSPDLYILDWEGWGVGPRGLDAAFLLGFSLLQPCIADKVRSTFESELTAHDGRIATLFVCSELLRMAELHGDHPELITPLEELAEEAKQALV